jgi:hypothetical protein
VTIDLQKQIYRETQAFIIPMLFRMNELLTPPTTIEWTLLGLCFGGCYKLPGDYIDLLREAIGFINIKIIYIKKEIYEYGQNSPIKAAAGKSDARRRTHQD